VDAGALAARLGCRCETAPSDYAAQAEMVLGELQAQLKSKTNGPVLIQIVAPASGPHQVSAGLSGLLKSAKLETPKLIGQMISVDGGAAEVLAAKLRENGLRPQDAQIRYLGGVRQTQGWRELQAEARLIPWRAGGVYLITGGLGGLGRIFSEEIARRASGARLVLTGRRELDEAGRAWLRELEALGAEASYRAVDVADRDAARDLILRIQEAHEGLNGIVHGAGVICDGLLPTKSAESLRRVLAPKVAGLVNLDEASRDVDLDWFLCFSSLTAALGNVGQTDYAAGNAFMDSFAAHRNSLAALGQRRGRTVSVNWPLWAEGGMGVSAAAERAMEEATGMAAMPTPDGVDALCRALACGCEQVAVMSGDAKRMRRMLRAEASPVAVAPDITDSTDETSPDLRERAGHYLKKRFAAALRLPLEKVEIDAPLEEYGIDSIMVLNLTSDLETVFGPLSKTLFFEYQTLQALAGYFVERHAAELKPLLGLSPVPAAAAAVAAPAKTPAPLRRTANRSRSQGVKLTPAREDIAIIGVAGRYPQARDLEIFWENLRNGVDSITEAPKDRWDHSRYYDPDKNKAGSTYAKWGGFIDGVDEFDPLFFNIAPRDAERIDPQERLFLQCAYTVLEDAGYAGKALEQQQGLGLMGDVGVYVGVMYEEYQLYAAQQQLLGNMLTVSNSPASIANRVSYFLNLHGPSMAVDTMCSSSLTAIHLACESIRRGECVCAIAGGVNVSIHPNKYLMLGEGKFASSKGRCESFGEGGDGYVPGEGVGAVLLKPLSRALADGDHVYGVIKATAVNHGGKTNGCTVPNPAAQANVIARAIREAGVDPRAISYVEAHGTGTALGDPIEIAGLSKAFGDAAQDRQFCALGSVKSNIGHCESAAGIAGLTKVLLQMKHGQLAPSLHSQTLNPNIDFERTPFVVQRELADWRRPEIEIDGERKQYRRIAGLSSFGAGGSNAHVIVEEYTPELRLSEGLAASQPALVVLSAKTTERLQERARLLLMAIQQGAVTQENLIDAAYTLQVGREAMEERLALIVSSVEELTDKLKSALAGDAGADGVIRGQAKRSRDELSALAADEDMARTIDAWIAKGKLRKLADLWVKGLAFDWSRLYGERRPRRISLPTYPFAQERYWIAETAALSAAQQFRPDRRAADRNGHFDREFFAKLFRDIDDEVLSVDSALVAAHQKL
jgi:polyketide synthase PksN